MEGAVKTGVFLLMLWTGRAGAESPVVPSLAASVPAVVSPTEAVFRISAPEREQWVWNLGRPGVREFGWVVEVSTPAGVRWLGVQIWHEEGGVPTKGPLSALVATAEVGVWPATDSRGPPLAGMPVAAEVQGSEIVLRVTDPAALESLFASRPATVRFVSHRGHGPQPDQSFTRSRSRTIHLVYRH